MSDMTFDSSFANLNCWTELNYNCSNISELCKRKLYETATLFKFRTCKDCPAMKHEIWLVEHENVDGVCENCLKQVHCTPDKTYYIVVTNLIVQDSKWKFKPANEKHCSNLTYQVSLIKLGLVEGEYNG